MNRPITSTDIETVILKFPTKKNQGQERYAGKFYQTFREDITPILLKLLEKIAEEETPPSSFYEAAITLILKLDKDTTKKKIIGQYY